MGNQLTGVISSGENNNRKTLLLREALDHNIKFNVNQLLKNEKEVLNEFYNSIRSQKKLGCKWNHYLK